MKTSFKNNLTYSAMLLTLVLTGCDLQKNPLLTEATIRDLKNDFFWESDDYPIRECTNYYSDPKSAPMLKARCDQWSEKTYKNLLNHGQIPTTTTLENFRDPKLWQKVKPK